MGQNPSALTGRDLPRVMECNGKGIHIGQIEFDLYAYPYIPGSAVITRSTLNPQSFVNALLDSIGKAKHYSTKSRRNFHQGLFLLFF